MASVLILSSFVAASRVGGGARALALARLGIEPILVPTVLLGRHPGHGPPGGGPASADTMEAMLGGIEAQGLFGQLEAVITGYFSTPEQTALAARTIDKAKAARPATRIVVDPIMGDAGKGLYVREETAAALAGGIVPRADLIAPNAWELGRLAGRPADDPETAIAAARALGKPTLVSSLTAGEGLGVLYVDAREARLASHAGRTRRAQRNRRSAHRPRSWPA